MHSLNQKHILIFKIIKLNHQFSFQISNFQNLNHYQILQVKNDATSQEIKLAF